MQTTSSSAAEILASSSDLLGKDLLPATRQLEEGPREHHSSYRSCVHALSARLEVLNSQIEPHIHPRLQRHKEPLRNLPDALRLSLIHISEPTRRTPISYAVFCLKK